MIPQPTAPQTPQLPGSPAGSPAGPGASPMAAPGAGGGNQAAAIAAVKAAGMILRKALPGFPFGSKESAAITRAMSALEPLVGKNEEQSLVPSAIQQMAMASQNGPLKNAPPIGIQPSAPPGASEAA